MHDAGEPAQQLDDEPILIQDEVALAASPMQTMDSVVPSCSLSIIRCVYFFAGAKRKGDIRSHLVKICEERGLHLDMQEIDLLRGSDHNLADSQLQDKWIKSLGSCHFVLATPPCSTHSRAVWANSFGPCPIRSKRYPRGFPWLSSGHRSKVDLFNGLVDFSWRVLFEVDRLAGSQPIIGFAEHPEDLGRVRGYRLTDSPASIWQSDECNHLVERGWWCGAFSQEPWGAPTAKPTRCIANSAAFNIFGDSVMPSFDNEGYYEGPVHKQQNKSAVSLMRKKGDDGPFRTAAAAAYPDDMCKAIATALFKALDLCMDRVWWENPLVKGTSKPLDEEKLLVVPAFPPIPPSLPPSIVPSSSPVLRFSQSQKSLLDKRLLELKIKTLKDSLKVKLAARDKPCSNLPIGDNRLQVKPKWQLTEGVDFIRAGWYGKGDPIHTIKSPGRFGRIMVDGGGLCSPGRWDSRNRILPSLGATLTASIDRWLDSRTFTATEDLRRDLVAKILGGSFEQNPFAGPELGALKFEWGCIFSEAGLVRPKALRRAGLIIDFGFLYLVGQYLQDPDFASMAEFCEGVRIGVDTTLKRTMEVWPPKAKWPLNEFGTDPVTELNQNYPSAKTFHEQLLEDIADQKSRGWILETTLEEAQKRFGKVSVAALAVIEEKPGKTRTLLDGSNHVQINHRIRVQDGEMLPTALDVQAALSAERSLPSDLVGLVVDVEKAHQQVPVHELDWGHVAFSATDKPTDPAKLGAWKIYLKTVGTYGIASASWQWGRVAALFQRIVYYIGLPLFLFRFADDLMLISGTLGQCSYTLPVLRFIVLCGLCDIPLKWSKTRGGVQADFVGYYFCFETLRGGMAERRALWLSNWARTTAENRMAMGRDLRAALGRFSFSAALLRYLLPFLGPLFSWAAVLEEGAARPLPPALVIILTWLSRKVLANPLVSLRIAAPVHLSRFFKADAKAEGDTVIVGGYEDDGTENLSKCRWFSVRLTRENAEWAFVKEGEAFRVIASLELFASLLCLMLFVAPNAGRSKASLCFYGVSDNQGNTALINKASTGRFPLYLILMELTEQLALRQISLDLVWQRRELNQSADDLTNEEFGNFSEQLRIPVVLSDLNWVVLPELYKEARDLHEDIQSRKHAKALQAKPPPSHKAHKAKRKGLRVTDPW